LVSSIVAFIRMEQPARRVIGGLTIFEPLDNSPGLLQFGVAFVEL